MIIHKNTILRVTIGAFLLILAIMLQGPQNKHLENEALGFVAMVGLVLLLPSIEFTKKYIMPEIQDKRLKSKLDTVRALYLGSIVGCLITLSLQYEFTRTGHVYVGRGYDYSISGITAQQQIIIGWIGTAIAFLIGLILHIRLKRHACSAEFIKEKPEPPSFVICPRCAEPLWGKDNPSMFCTKCQSPLEDVHGFYDRHPEIERARGNVPPKTVS